MRKGTPLRAIVETIFGARSAVVACFGLLLEGASDETKEIVVETIEKTSETITNIVEDIKSVISPGDSIFDKIHSLLNYILNLLSKIPEIVLTIINNVMVFFYIFCFLIVIGRFDWLLEHIYTLTALSLVLTYLTYRQ